MVGVVALQVQHTEQAGDRFDGLPSERDQCRDHHHLVADYGRTAPLIHPHLIMNMWRTVIGCIVVQTRLPLKLLWIRRDESLPCSCAN